MSGMKPYVVRQGEYLAKIAFCEGFEAAATWADASNRDLAQRRPNENALCAGDVLFIPEQPSNPVGVNVGGANHVTGDVPKVDLRMELLLDESPAGQAFVIRGMNGEEIRGTVNGAGVVEARVSTLMREAVLLIPEREIYFPIMVGGLDCARTDSGAEMRMRNLGHAPDGQALTEDTEVPETGALCPFARQPREVPGKSPAIAAYQRRVNLEPSGEFDDDTRRRLEAEYGT